MEKINPLNYYMGKGRAKATVSAEHFTSTSQALSTTGGCEGVAGHGGTCL